MDNSPLSKLPAEIRNEMYDLALKNDNCKITRQARLSCGSENKHPLALTQTCRAVRQETQLTFFAVNTFTFYGVDHRIALRKLLTFVDNIEELVRHGATRVRVLMTADMLCSCSFVLLDFTRCYFFDKVFEMLAELHKWSLQYPQASLELHLRNNHGTWYLPIDLEHFCSYRRAQDPTYLRRYERAFKEGAFEGSWSEFESLTELKIWWIRSS